MKLSKDEELMLLRLEKRINTKGVSKEFLVQLFELSGLYGGFETISNYGKIYGISYNGVKKTRNIKTIRGVKFVIGK